MGGSTDDGFDALREAVRRRMRAQGKLRFARAVEIDYKTLMRFVDNTGPTAPTTIAKLEEVLNGPSDHERRINETLTGASLEYREMLVDVLRSWQQRDAGAR